jgi:hypothetical protein
MRAPHHAFSNPNLPRSVALCAGLLAYLFLRVALLWDRVFDTDEFEHLHAAWCTVNHQVIYKDFFEHHGPLFPLLLSPLFLCFQNPITIMLAGRTLIMAMWVAFPILQWRLAKDDSLLIRGASVLFLLSFTTFADKSLEIRPDVPAAILVVVVLSLARQATTARDAYWMGLLLGVAIVFTPKALYPAVGISLGALLRLRQTPGWRGGSAARFTFAMLAGGVLPPAITAMTLYRAGAAKEFYEVYILLNLHFKNHFPVWIFLIPSVIENCGLWALSFVGLYFKRRDYPFSYGFISTLIGLLFLPVPYPQYYLFIGPFLAYAAAVALSRVKSRLDNARLPERGVALAFLGIIMAYPFAHQLRMLWRSNETQKINIACVMRNTQSNDIVFDMWSGFSFFRQHAWYMWMLHEDIQAMFRPGELEKYIRAALANESCAWLIWDSYFDKLPAEVKDYAAQHFHPAGCGCLYGRN